MSSAMMRGRTLKRGAVIRAKIGQKLQLNELLSHHRTALTSKERGEARRLTGRWDFWNYLTPTDLIKTQVVNVKKASNG